MIEIRRKIKFEKCRFQIDFESQRCENVIELEEKISNKDFNIFNSFLLGFFVSLFRCILVVWSEFVGAIHQFSLGPLLGLCIVPIPLLLDAVCPTLSN